MQDEAAGGMLEGVACEANYRGRGKWYPAKIVKVYGNGIVDIDYDDGEFERGVEEERTRLPLPKLTADAVKGGLGVLGKHPILLNHAFLELKVTGTDATDISILQQYPHLMYVNLSQNRVESTSVLAHLPTLVQLDLSNNKIKRCLNFKLAKCSKDSAWPTGHTSIGSMLTNANLSHNDIDRLDDLSDHPFLEVLMLGSNRISCIADSLGASLKFLRVLDLSNNMLTTVRGLEGLPVLELNLSGNAISDVSGLDTCEKLSSLNLRNNKVRTLAPLRGCSQLMWLDVGANPIQFIRQCDFLAQLKWLDTLLLMGSPCSKKRMYRRRVVHRLPHLCTLDESDVTAEERIETGNLFRTELSDMDGRKRIFHEHFPKLQFQETAEFVDDEQDLTVEELQEL